MWHLSKIPKKAHFYWGNSILPIDRFLSIASFAANNRDWAVLMHRPLGLAEELDTSWETHEHKKIKSCSTGNCFWDALSKLDNVEVVKHDFDFLGGMSEVHKSDFLRWELLANDGGLWSDIDILYLRPMDDVYFNVAEPCVVDVDGFKVSLEPDIIAEVFCASSLEHGGPFNSIGFLMSSPGSEVFKELCRLRDFTIEKGGAKTLKRDYQSLGRKLLDLMVHQHPFLTGSPSYKKAQLSWGDTAIITTDLQLGAYAEVPLPGGINIPMDVVYPYGDHTILKALRPNDYQNWLITDRTIGVHWYGGHPKVGPMMASWNMENLDDLPASILKDLICEVVSKHKDYLFPALP